MQDTLIKPRSSCASTISSILAAEKVVAAPRQFDAEHLGNPELRALLQKIEVVANPEFTQADERLPVEHRTRVTAVTSRDTGGSHP